MALQVLIFAYNNVVNTSRWVRVVQKRTITKHALAAVSLQMTTHGCCTRLFSMPYVKRRLKFERVRHVAVTTSAGAWFLIHKQQYI
jgi:hypothetical protein